MDKNIFIKIIKLLNLEFLPQDLVYLALNNNLPDNVKKIFETKYFTTNYQTLEFYGDKFLSVVIILVLYRIYGLNISPSQSTKLYETFSSNFNILDQTISIGYCQELVKSLRCKWEKPLEKHNICTDSFEAIIGAMGFYFISKNIPLIENLYNWYINLDFIKKYIKKEQISFEQLDLNNGQPILWSNIIDMNNPNLWKTCNIQIISEKTEEETYIKKAFPFPQSGSNTGYIDSIIKYYNDQGIASRIFYSKAANKVIAELHIGNQIFVGSGLSQGEALKNLIKMNKS